MYAGILNAVLTLAFYLTLSGWNTLPFPLFNRGIAVHLRLKKVWPLVFSKRISCLAIS
jgi:hypothetical protein